MKRSHGWGGDVQDGHLRRIAEGRGTKTKFSVNLWNTGWEDRKLLSPLQLGPAANLKGFNAATAIHAGVADSLGWFACLVGGDVLEG